MDDVLLTDDRLLTDETLLGELDGLDDELDRLEDALLLETRLTLENEML